MPPGTVEGEKSFEVEAGRKLVLAIEDAGIDILHRCGGNARCTPSPGPTIAGARRPRGGVGPGGGAPEPMGELERARLAREGNLGPDIRLSCQIHVASDLTV